MRSLCVALAVAASNACAAGTVHYVDLVNTAPASIRSFSVAAAGSDDFRDVALGSTSVRGGGDSTTIRISDGDCLRDFRTVFADGRVLVQQNFDVCRNRSYHTGQYLRRNASAAALAKS
jgi:hypothetical protein